MDPWYLLKCPSCRATLRIKSEYVSMPGKCPVCKMRVEAPIPKPLSMDDDLSSEALWPEPAQVIGHGGVQELEAEPVSFNLSALQPTSAPPTPATVHEKVEEETLGTYNLAFEPDAPKLPGITRSAEWDQATPPSVVSEPAALVKPTAIPKSVLPPMPAVEPSPAPETYRTEVDPLFGDEVKVEVKTAMTPAGPAAQPAPIARLAEPDAVVAKPVPIPDVKMEPVVPLPADEDSPPKKKKTKADGDDTGKELPVPESYAHLNKPTEDTHLYRLSMAEENRVKLDSPPALLFMDGVLNFPFQVKNLPPFIWLLLHCAFNFSILRLMQHVLDTPSMFSTVGAGALGMALFMAAVFAVSFGCACWSSTIIYTSAGSHAVDWATEGWKENVVVALRFAYYFLLALMCATPMLVFSAIGIGSYLWLLGTLFLFPIFLFSGLASLTFWNFLHGEVIKKTFAKLPYYLTMYLISVVMFAITGAAVYFTMQYYILVLVSAPLAAYTWLVYGRLLGRMAWLLQQEPKRKKKKKKKKKSAEEQEAESAEAEEEEEARELVGANEKGPREDARGPGGARPV